MQFCIMGEAMLLQLCSYQSQRKFGTPDGNIELAEYVWESADVIFVAVGQYYPLHLIGMVEKVSDIGDDDIHAEHFLIGEHQPAIND